jgi:hypothetical protein
MLNRDLKKGSKFKWKRNSAALLYHDGKHVASVFYDTMLMGQDACYRIRFKLTDTVSNEVFADRADAKRVAFDAVCNQLGLVIASERKVAV